MTVLVLVVTYLLNVLQVFLVGNKSDVVDANAHGLHMEVMAKYFHSPFRKEDRSIIALSMFAGTTSLPRASVPRRETTFPRSNDRLPQRKHLSSFHFSCAWCVRARLHAKTGVREARPDGSRLLV